MFGLRCRQRGVARENRYLRQSEVENLGLPSIRHIDVCGLDITMNDVRAVCGIERISDSDGDLQQRLQLYRSAADALLESLSFEQLHRDEVPALMFADVVNRADVRMIQRGRCARLTKKS